ncbi:hypothetical protein NC651_017185 [Populus alba x Populus x berolinensis]|nr:hypothetical protein NC651_017185 [Populus alba x Populus x berolinensis]
MQEQAASSIPAYSFPSSSERSSSSAPQLEVKEGMESDEEIRKSARDERLWQRDRFQLPVRAECSLQERDKVRGREEGVQSDKDNKRLKRLLRNRVSDQQAKGEEGLT